MPIVIIMYPDIRLDVGIFYWDIKRDTKKGARHCSRPLIK
jgi:hypothetical protein